MIFRICTIYVAFYNFGKDYTQIQTSQYRRIDVRLFLVDRQALLGGCPSNHH